MPVSDSKKRIEETVFAHKLLEHGMNGKAAMQDIKPHLTEHSAEVAASRMISRVEQSGAIDNLMAGARAQWEAIARDCMAQLHESAMAGDREAHKLLIEYGKLFAHANSVPRSLTQVNKYTIPKR